MDEAMLREIKAALQMEPAYTIAESIVDEQLKSIRIGKADIDNIRRTEILIHELIEALYFLETKKDFSRKGHAEIVAALDHVREADHRWRSSLAEPDGE